MASDKKYKVKTDLNFAQIDSVALSEDNEKRSSGFHF
jgi:hypothetical protein